MSNSVRLEMRGVRRSFGAAVRVMDCAGRAQRRRRFRADGDSRVENNFRACESGVALRFPPQSKKSQALRGVVFPKISTRLSA